MDLVLAMTKMRNKFRLALQWIPLLMAMTILVPAHAIIIRHDKGYGDYLQRENRYPQVFFLEQQGRRKVCVATVINASWAITAAHCADETGLGAAIENKEKFTVTIANQQRTIDQMIIHPDYRADSSAGVDLALIHFDKPLAFPRSITLNHDDNLLHKVVTIMGWGFFGLGTTGRQYDDGDFRVAQNRIESVDNRLHIHFDDPRQQTHAALELEGMPGLGDSGGPALLVSADGWILAGVAVGEVMDENFNEETQGSYGAIAVYENIAWHREWIVSSLEVETVPSGD